MAKPAIWALTTGEAGMRTQALGLAEAVGGDIVEKRIGVRWPWSLLPGHLCPDPLARLAPGSDSLEPPWPDLLVTCGRRATGASIAIRRLSSGRTLTVHVENPVTPARAFDLVAPMIHDGITGPNVMPVATALNRVTSRHLAGAAIEWGPRFAAIPAPRLGIMFGGATKGYSFDRGRFEKLLDDLESLHQSDGTGILVTPSRRTGAHLTRRIVERFSGKDWAYVWDGSGDNPFFGILALADGFLVTEDSVSMVSEAIATGRPTATVALGKLRSSHARFGAVLAAKGLVRPFSGRFPVAADGQAAYRDPTAEVAQRVREMLAERARTRG